MNKNAQIKEAMELLVQGNIQEADRIFCDFLQQMPDHDEALYGRACVALMVKSSALAIGFAGRAIQIKAKSEYYVTLGMALYEEKHVSEALSALKSALILKPSNARAYHALARIQQDMGRIEEAVCAYKEAISLNPEEFLYWNDLINFYWKMQYYEQALQTAQEAVKRNLGEVNYLHKLAVILQGLELYKEAELILKKIIHLYPLEISAYANLGAVLFQENKLDEARNYLHYAVNHQTYTLETQVNMALVKMACGDLLTAEKLLEKAYYYSPFDIRIGLNLGTVYFETRELDKAEALYHALIEQANVAQFSTVDVYKLYYNYSSVLLAKKQWDKGWEYMESRHVLLNSFEEYKDISCWNGEETKGALLIRAEQGLGDCLQFLRFLPLIAEKSRVVLQVPFLQVRLVKEIIKIHGLSDICTVIEKGERLTETIDYQCMLMSLPYFLGMNSVPLAQSYYFHSGQSFTYKKQHKKKIGICWAGNSGYRFDRLRSIPLDLLYSLFKIQNIEFYSLQANTSKQDLPVHFDYVLPKGDLLDTAYIIQTLDLVITVDTVIAHLAAMLGKPVWLLNRFGGDWRWYGKNTENIWYPTVKIFRQKDIMPFPVAWEPVIEEVKKALQEFANM